ncbi:MAG: type I-F CRISPR-associated helicase Cas3f [Polyangiaceae bacterium]|nr:type I-F CRISPR-associated helicase Cas3f [Polyangiaceae bacterium]
MNVLIVSQCDKRALPETRRILDQFAERRGNRTWQTPITQAGLDTLRKMLRRSARKNTAVACHWIRGRDHSELVWVVGNAGRFNEVGAVPTNTTERDVLRGRHENDWLTGEEIRLLAVMASLFHDFGKSSQAFQTKLTASPGQAIADAYRHEWVSLRLFEAFVGTDDDSGWLTRLVQCDENASADCLSRLARDDQKGCRSPFSEGRLPPLAQAVGWLVVSHHRLLLPQSDARVGTLRALLSPVLANWNGAREGASDQEKRDCWHFPRGLPFASRDWRARASKCARDMLSLPVFVERAPKLLDDHYTMHLARASLMLADHHYSSGPSETRYGDAAFPLYANTDRKTGQLKQRLDEHLVGVSRFARRVVLALPRLERELPRIARAKAFKRRSTDERFRWQDKSYDLACGVRQHSLEHGFFGVNMASTGCGKTLANGRIVYALADPAMGARFTVALGLRTLTLQTGEAYRKRLHLGDDDLAVLVGGGGVRQLFEMGNGGARGSWERHGSESAEELLSDDSYVHFEGSLTDGPLKDYLSKDHDTMKLLQAPVLCCTIDHLVPATESLRGGRQIGPMLRLMSSDLVLDEPDDFDVADLPALSRLVHWAGMLGSRVLLSSATLPPSLVEGLFEAYRAGRASFQSVRGAPGRALSVSCAWFDEYRCESSQFGNSADFRQGHNQFVDRRLSSLREAAPRRKVELVVVKSATTERDGICTELGQQLVPYITELHRRHHTVDPMSAKRVSFGLIRMANIEPLIRVAQALCSQEFDRHRLHLCVYHSHHLLLVRAGIERTLDKVLQRSQELAVFEEPEIRAALDADGPCDQAFVVIASPVAEVGRDHDYDWAIVEPSSMRSIIQLAGRVRRHRPGGCTEPNMMVFHKNVKALANRLPAYCRPGFELEGLMLKTHDLRELLTSEQLDPLDASSRIRERITLDYEKNLVDLEQQRLRMMMLGLGASPTAFSVPMWWQTRAPLSGVLQHAQRFRAGEPMSAFALVPNEEGEEFGFQSWDREWANVGSQFKEVGFQMGPHVRLWGAPNYRDELLRLAEELDMDLVRCARRFGLVQLPERTQGWWYCSSLGFWEHG